MATEAPPVDRRELYLLGAILLIAFGLRAAWAVAVPARTLGANFDATVYHYGAVRIMEGWGYGSRDGVPSMFFPPGYSGVLAAAYSLFGPHLIVAKFVNVVADTLTCGLVYAIGRRSYGRPVAGIAACIYALYPAHIYAVSATMSDIVFTSAFTLTLYLLLRWDGPESGAGLGRRFAVVGLLLGLTSLIRGIALPFLGALLLGSWLTPSTRRQALRRTTFAALGLALVVAPWTLRNYQATGSFVLLSTDGAWALFNAHSPEAFGSQDWNIQRNRRELFADEMALPYPEREVALEKAQMRYAIRYAATHPLHELSMIPWRIYHLYEHDVWAFKWIGKRHRSPETGRMQTRVFGPDWDPVLEVVANRYLQLLLGLAAVGWVLALLPARRAHWLVPVVVLYFNAMHGLLFFGIPRYHAAFAPMLAILAALTLWTAAARLRRQRDREPPRVASSERVLDALGPDSTARAGQPPGAPMHRRTPVSLLFPLLLPLVLAVVLAGSLVSSAAAGTSELIESLMGLGVSEKQAVGGAGSIFEAAKSNLAPSEYETVSKALPGIDALRKSAPKLDTGSLGSLAAAVGGDKASQAADLVNRFKKLGLDANMVQAFIPPVLDYAKKMGGPSVMKLLQGALL